MTKQQFIDYMYDYGCHVLFKYGDSYIQKKTHLTPNNSFYPHFELVTSKGSVCSMSFEIDGKPASIEQCIVLVTAYSRDNKLKEIGI